MLGFVNFKLCDVCDCVNLLIFFNKCLNKKDVHIQQLYISYYCLNSIWNSEKRLLLDQVILIAKFKKLTLIGNYDIYINQFMFYSSKII